MNSKTEINTIIVIMSINKITVIILINKIIVITLIKTIIVIILINAMTVIILKVKKDHHNQYKISKKEKISQHRI